MPSMHGLGFLQKVNNKDIKTILLTGEASHELAVEAFNDRIIDQFILKSHDQLLDIINQGVEKLRIQYYQDLSSRIINSSENTEHSLKVLRDSSFANLFNKTLQEKNIVEFYIVDYQGSFILLDKNAKPFWLIIKSDEEMQKIYESAAFESGPGKIIKDLKNRTAIPFFYSEQDYQTPLDNWAPYMHPATQLKGEAQNYYYALLEEPKQYQLVEKHITCYNAQGKDE